MLSSGTDWDNGVSETFRKSSGREGVAWPVTRVRYRPRRADGQETVQAEPFSVKAAGLAVLPVCVPLKPKLVDAPAAIVPL